MLDLYKAELEVKGYTFLSRLLPNLSDCEIASYFGEISNVGGRKPHQLSPKAQEYATPNSYSGIYGLDSFPLHTDLAHWRNPPHYLMLRCHNGFKDVITSVVDAKSVVARLDPSILERAVVRPRRPVRGKLPLLRLLSPRENRFGLFRWDPMFLCPAMESAKSAIQIFSQALQQECTLSFALSERGDTLVIDNWRLLHGRSSVLPEHCSRVITRTYLEKLH